MSKSIWIWFLAGLYCMLSQAALLVLSHAQKPQFRALSPSNSVIYGRSSAQSLAFWAILNLTLMLLIHNRGKGKRSEHHDSFLLFETPLGLLLSPSLQSASGLSESFSISL